LDSRENSASQVASSHWHEACGFGFDGFRPLRQLLVYLPLHFRIEMRYCLLELRGARKVKGDFNAHVFLPLSQLFSVLPLLGGLSR
jgi:hypothetical protein